ncbi:SDR family NAD(P)-dependent oxidoreductase [Cryobacterium sp. GrIS_2_6]|uniref:SDR family NAD(P)-dependent oxidoreductase n=1 Tax=Cryobacterium sp. GrIS_2_6 TaxID=3162785 RepID=UPI0034DD28F3
MSSTIGTDPTIQVSRVALVTGGSGGIGRAVVERLAEDGFALGVHYAGNQAKADETVAAVLAAGGRAIAVGDDVAEEGAMSDAFDAVEAEFGGVDVVVNTAGIMLLSPIATLDLADLDRIYRANSRGTVVVPAGGPPGPPGRSDHQLLHLRHPHPVSRLRRIRGEQGRGREHHAHPRP